MRLFLFSLIFTLHIYGKSKACDSSLAYSDLPKAINDGIVRIENKLDQNLISTRDQDSVGHCYAYAAADLLEDWLKRKGKMPDNEHISALALALNYKKEDYIAKAPEYYAAAIKKDLLAPKFKELQGQFQKIDTEINTLNANKLSANTDKEKAVYDFEIEKKEKELRFLKSVYQELEKQFYQEDYTIPDGGYPDVISKAWPLICYESEVNSRDQVHSDYLSQESKAYPYYSEENKQLGLLNQLSIEPHVAEPNYCVMSSITYEIFPGIDANKIDIIEVLKKVSSSPDFLQRLVEEACQKKNLGGAPEMIELSSSDLIPNTVNNHVLKNIDQALSNKKLAIINYRSQVLSQEHMADDITDHHASVIVGNGKVCGEDFYILRNSWGKDACKNDTSNLLSHRDYVKETKIDCNLEAKNKAEFKFKDCVGSNCKAQKQKEQKLTYQECLENAGVVDMKFPKHLPYFCDEQGNYYVKKNIFKKYIYESTTITD